MGIKTLSKDDSGKNAPDIEIGISSQSPIICFSGAMASTSAELDLVATHLYIEYGSVPLVFVGGNPIKISTVQRRVTAALIMNQESAIHLRDFSNLQLKNYSSKIRKK